MTMIKVRFLAERKSGFKQTMRTRCCHTRHYKVESQVLICLNPECSNYLASTSLHSKIVLKAFTAGLLFCFVLCFCKNDYSSVQQAALTGNPSKLKKMINCSDASLKAEIAEKKIICPDEVYAQIVIESSHMTSFLFKRANNLIGMRYPFKRVTTATGIYLPDEDTIIKGSQKELAKYKKRNQFAVYECWQDCISDYKMWQDQCFQLTERYLNFLGNYYAEDTQYIQKIKKARK